ncbi:MAG: putative membrane protein [Candidatus Collierbacteria bacterium GW2011_GWB1_44_6]|uniref:Putative membrane protein n=1 Tax=Candidatus Collierbacteria bacterium GW2011_GWB1_44_6 TaxID=1618384 RepID=A0A0G1JLX7_9BACT|nr:MAG: putative membrane protein [Candidatus Collierbacteria bacterium GW2011_GWB1_44_6]
MQSTNLLIIFLTGLTTGGLTCLALQGGLLTSVITKQEEKLLDPLITSSKKKLKHTQSVISSGVERSHSTNLTPILSFLSAKLVTHTLLGFMLGFLGQNLTLSPITRGWLQIFIGIYLFGVAGNLLDLHPFFRYFIITPPKFLMRLIKNESKSKSTFAPALLGAMTIFIPCATTQAMEVIAIGTGNPLFAAAIMFSFVLGTSPTFLIFGFLLNQGSHWFRKYFPAVAATAMFGMSIFSINGGSGLIGSPYTLQNFWGAATANSSPREANTAVLGDKVQTVTINVANSGYSPTNITLKKGVPAIITLVTNNVQSCSRAFSIPALNIQKLLPETGETIVEFTPDKIGPLAFSCSMGMYTGRFNIIN